MKRLRCEQCGIAPRAKFAWFGYEKEFPLPAGPSGKARSRKLRLCPDCAGTLLRDVPAHRGRVGSLRRTPHRHGRSARVGRGRREASHEPSPLLPRRCLALEAIGLCLIPLVVKRLPADEPIVVSLDDTLSRPTGKHIREASMHHDPLLSTRAKPVFHWGHVWVVVSIVVRVPLWRRRSRWVLARRYRSEKLCAKDKRPFRKKTELAAELIAILAGALPERRIRIVADANYANASILKKRPSNADFIARAPMDAAVHARPRRQRMGRPAVKGSRLPDAIGYAA